MILAGLEPAILDRGRECFVLLRAIFQRSSLEVLSHAYPREKNSFKEVTLQGAWFRISLAMLRGEGEGKSAESRLLMTQWPPSVSSWLQRPQEVSRVYFENPITESLVPPERV